MKHSLKIRYDALDNKTTSKILDLLKKNDEAGLRAYLKELGFTVEEIEEIIKYLKGIDKSAYIKMINALKVTENIHYDTDGKQHGGDQNDQC